MKSRVFLNRLPAVLLFAGLGFLILWFVLKASDRGEPGEEEEEVIPEAAHVTTLDGRTVITLSEAERAANGIVTAALLAVTHRKQVRGYGSVIDLRELIDLRNAYTTAKSTVVETRARLRASRKEYVRLERLYKQDRNASEKSLQAAEAAWRSDQAAAEASRSALTAQKNLIEQQWGTVIAGWLFEYEPAFARLTARQDVLIQLTLPPESGVPAAADTALVVRNGKEIEAKLVSQAPRTDPRIQGVSYYYLAPAEETGLLPGMNTFGYLPTGREMQGVIVPASAVVWLQGTAWVFVAEGTDRFSRRKLPTDTPVKEGWFVAKAFSPGDRIVTGGAQVLLSEEFRARIQVEG